MVEKMNGLMVNEQREMIYNSIPDVGSMLEWGSGGTTVWLAERLKGTQCLVSVEHHREWANKVKQATSHCSNYTMRFRPPSVLAEVGVNATAMEENPSALDGYINQPDLGNYDVILVDGVARGACLMKVFAEAMPGAKIFLHDAHRTWYQWALRSHRILDAGKLDGGMMVNYPDAKAPDLWFCTLV